MSANVNYLNNKDIMEEIHKSKTSFCSFSKKEYHNYDIILSDINDINEHTLQIAKQNRAKRLSQKDFEHRKHVLKEKVKLVDCEVSAESISDHDIIFRIMTYDHIPMHPGRKKTPKTIADHKEKINFPPFQHWKLNDEQQLECVGKSHWKGDVHTGYFCKTHGKITDKLARMYMKLCERYGTRWNVRMYSYLDEMKSNALLQLVVVGLQFDESKSDNPFAYLTSTLNNALIRVINTEKTNQKIRDELLEINGLNPSYTRTTDAEHEHSMRREDLDF